MTPDDSRAAGPSAQRRLVTVMFADLVGFTPFAEERDPEEVRGVLTRYADLSREIVARYGGSVEKFIGDAVMALWGAPVAHEDDAERAVRAALELADAVSTLGPGIQARAGILTGEAAVTVGATNQGMVAGDLVNSAARLQSVAAPGSVLVGEATMRAAEASLAFEPAGEQELKGKSAPVKAWRALRVIAQRRGAGRSETLETPFVGRDEEFRALRELLHVAGRDPRPRLISITGPAGIGKSRLAWELEKYIDGVVESIYWHRGRCPAYGDGVAFWALGEMVRRRCGLAESADKVETRRAVADTVAQYVTEESERGWIESAILVLLGLEPDQSVSRDLLFAGWRRFFEFIAHNGTAVLVFEDLQWADPAMLDFIDHVLDWSKSTPLLILTLSRPELYDRRPDWGAGRRTFTAMALEPLDEAAMRQMLAGLVPDLAESAVKAIIGRADGIPLYAVETVRMLLADGRLEKVDGSYRPTQALDSLAVPESLRSLISSRLDALSASDRSLVDDASVLGQTFGVEALGAVRDQPSEALGTTLRGLVRREVFTLEMDPRAPERGQFSFVQSLIREVAYATLARPDRRKRHLAAARFFESTAGDELAPVLAAHYLAAHENSTPGPEADAVAAQARVALRAAADRAAAVAGHEQAATYLDQAAGLTRDPGEQAAFRERAARESGLAGHYTKAEALVRTAIEQYRSVGDVASSTRAMALLGTCLIDQSRVKEALQELDAAASQLAPGASDAATADLLVKLARALYRNLRHDRAIEVVDRALIMAQNQELRVITAEGLVTKGVAYNMTGRPHESLALVRAGIDLAKREGDMAVALRGMANIPGLVASEEGSAAATAVIREAIDVARSVGDVGQLVWHVGNLTWNALYPGRPLAPVIEELTSTLEMRLDPSDRTHLETRLLVTRAIRGDDVIPELEAARVMLVESGDPQTVPEVDMALALAALSHGDLRTAAPIFARLGEENRVYITGPMAVLCAAATGDEALTGEMRERMERRPISGAADRAAREAALAAHAALNGRTREALDQFRAALNLLRSRDQGFHQYLTGLAMLGTLGRDRPEALAAGQEALAIAERMGSPGLVNQARRLLGAEPVRDSAGRAAEPTSSSPIGA